MKKSKLILLLVLLAVVACLIYVESAKRVQEAEAFSRLSPDEQKMTKLVEHLRPIMQEFAQKHREQQQEIIRERERFRRYTEWCTFQAHVISFARGLWNF